MSDPGEFCTRCDTVYCSCSSTSEPPTDPAPKPIVPIADRIRDVADAPETLYHQRPILRAIASEIEIKAEQMRASGRLHANAAGARTVFQGAIDEWADSLAKRKD